MTTPSQVAQHESAHAVAAHRLGVPIGCVTIDPAGPVMQTNLSKPRDVGERLQQLRSQIVIDLASNYVDADQDACDADELNALRRAVIYAVTTSTNTIVGLAEAAKLLTEELKQVADQLIETCRPEAGELVAANRHAIERLALRLDDLVTVDGAQVAAVIRKVDAEAAT
jgi:hypothetical protein